MIEADQRSGLRHAVSLDNGIAQTPEKFFCITRKRRAPGDQSPELPAEAAMDAAKHPSATKKSSACCLFKGAVQPLRLALAFEFPFDSRMKKIKYAGNRNERSGVFLFDGANDFSRIAGRFEDHGGSEERRNEQRRELAEDVAQRNEREEAQRVKAPLIFAIRIHPTLQRLKVRQKIAMRENDAARLGRCARSVKNFGNGASYGGVTRSYAGLRLRDRAGYNILQIVYDHRRCRTGQFHLLTVTQDELHPGIFNRALNELWGCRGVHRHDHGTAQEDAPEARNPFGGISSPEKNAIPRENAPPRKRITPEMGGVVELCVRQFFPTVAASLDGSDIARETGEIRE